MRIPVYVLKRGDDIIKVSFDESELDVYKDRMLSSYMYDIERRYIDTHIDMGNLEEQ